MSFNNSSYSCKNINDHCNKSSVEDEYVRTIGTMPSISTSFSSFGRNIVIPQTHRFSKIKQDHNWQSCGQHH